MSQDGKCTNCGAPYEEGLGECRYCDVPIPGRSAGIECPRCGELASADRRSCAPCGAEFVKGCIFCGQAAWITAPQCPRCHEAFEGAEARKQARDEAAKQQQMIGLAQQGLGVVGAVAAGTAGRGLLGGIIDAITGADPAPTPQTWGQHGHYAQKPQAQPYAQKPQAQPYAQKPMAQPYAQKPMAHKPAASKPIAHKPAAHKPAPKPFGGKKK